MTKLTDEAREKYDPGVRIRLRLASFVIGLGYRFMPREYYEDVQKEELHEMAKRYDGIRVVEVVDDAE